MWENTISLSEKKLGFHRTRCKEHEVKTPEEDRMDTARVQNWNRNIRGTRMEQVTRKEKSENEEIGL